MFSADPGVRARAARDLGRRDRRSLFRQADPWPADSPGSVNAWLLLVTTKPPGWRDALVQWRDHPPTLGAPHEGFFYPDPLGFWAEVRHWALTVVRQADPRTTIPDALTVTTALHLEGTADRLQWARRLMQPRVILFLDEPAWEAAGVRIIQKWQYEIADPHRAGQSYEGFWATDDHGTAIGKSPQHPATHRLYRRDDMDAFLSRVPVG